MNDTERLDWIDEKCRADFLTDTGELFLSVAMKSKLRWGYRQSAGSLREAIDDAMKREKEAHENPTD